MTQFLHHKIPVFQSHLGSILPWCCGLQSAPRRAFQSHLGSILPKRSGTRGAQSRKFQSHLGSILPRSRRLRRHLRSFVSIPPWFDFAPPSRRARVDFNNRFNPTLVRFCHLLNCTNCVVDLGFNPTLVRFCHQVVGHCCTVLFGFQSHLGSILPGWTGERWCAHHLGFNPTLVRFCLLKSVTTLMQSCVSIPPWFDFAHLSCETYTRRLLRFNPTLVRFCPRKVS